MMAELVSHLSGLADLTDERAEYLSSISVGPDWGVAYAWLGGYRL